jgi:hypothetical protein
MSTDTAPLDEVRDFSFVEWVQKTFSAQNSDEQEERRILMNFFNKCFSSKVIDEETQSYFNITQEIMADLLDCIVPLMRDPDANNETLQCICDSLEHIKTNWIEQVTKPASSNAFMDMENGYFLNVDSLPTSVLFWKSMINSRTLPRSRKMPRSALENEYKTFTSRTGSRVKFSHVLFSLSWLNVLRVYNNTQVALNSRCPIQF